MIFADLQALGVHTVLRNAALLLEERGLARQMHQDPDTGEIDVEGAVMLACGARELSVLVVRASDVVPPAHMARYEASLHYLDSITPGRIVSEWTDRMETTLLEVLELLRAAALDVASALCGLPPDTLHPSVQPSIRGS